MENRDPYEIHKSKTQKAIIRIITWVSQKKKKRGRGSTEVVTAIEGNEGFTQLFKNNCLIIAQLSFWVVLST